MSKIFKLKLTKIIQYKVFIKNFMRSKRYRIAGFSNLKNCQGSATVLFICQGISIRRQ